jgi:hypothetical protein
VGAERAVAGELVVRIFDRGPEPEWHRDRRYFGPWWRFEAEVPDYQVVNECGMSPWEAVHRLVANHRTVLERRWSQAAADQRDRRPDALIDLGDGNDADVVGGACGLPGGRR